MSVADDALIAIGWRPERGRLRPRAQATSLQLVGLAAVRARMLQLTPGAPYAAAAARADAYLPPTLGTAALDASAAAMQARLRSPSAQAAPPRSRALRESPAAAAVSFSSSRRSGGRAAIPSSMGCGIGGIRSCSVVYGCYEF